MPILSWYTPSVGVVKINTNGAFHYATQLASAGSLIRDSDGHWIKSFVFNIGKCSIKHVELLSIYKGLQLAWQGDFIHVEVKSDRLEVVRIMTKFHLTRLSFRQSDS